MSDIARTTVTQLAFGGKPRSARLDEKIVMAMVLVPEREDALNYYGSPDGDPTRVTNLPKKVVTLSRQIGPNFCLATMPGWLVRERKFVQARQPGLCRSVKWTEAERILWGGVCDALYVAREELYKAAAFRRRPKAERTNRDGIGTRYVSSGW